MATEQLLETLAHEMLADGLDYMETSYLKPGYILGMYHDGVWIVDARETCNMNNMPRIARVLEGPNA